MTLADLCACPLKSHGDKFDVGEGITLSYEIPRLFDNHYRFFNLVARCEGRTIGYALLARAKVPSEPETIMVGYPITLYSKNTDSTRLVLEGGLEVHPAFQRMGLGTALMSTVISVARAPHEGAFPVIAQPTKVYAGFFRAFGFVPAWDNFIRYDK